MRKRMNWLAAGAVMVAVLAVAVWGITPFCPNQGWQRLYLTNDGSAIVDTGVGFYKMTTSNADSTVTLGIFFVNSTKNTVDTNLANANEGFPVRITGKFNTTSNIGTYYIHRDSTVAADTGRIKVTVTWTDTAGVSTYGSWASTKTSGSGRAYDTYLWTGLYPTPIFADTTTAALDATSLTGLLSYETVVAYRSGNGTMDTVISVRGLDTGTNNKMRLVIFKDGYWYADSAMARDERPFALDSGVWSTVGHFETGAYEFWAIGWDTAQQTQTVIGRRLFIGARNSGARLTTVAQTTVSCSLPATAIYETVTISDTIGNPIKAVEIFPLTSGAPWADNFAQYDTHSYWLETRVVRSVFNIVPLDANGVPIAYTANSMTISGVVGDTANLPTTVLQQMSLMHLDERTGEWKKFATTWNGRTFTASGVQEFNFTPFALGKITSQVSSGSGNGCVLTSVLGNTALARALPALRDVRDVMMANPVGRLFVSGYYGLTALMLLVAGFGLTIAWKRR